MFGYDNSALFVQLAGLSGAPGYTDAVLSKGKYELFGYNFPDFNNSEVPGRAVRRRLRRVGPNHVQVDHRGQLD